MDIMRQTLFVYRVSLGTRNILREYLFPLFLCNKITIFVMNMMLCSNFDKYFLVFLNLIPKIYRAIVCFFFICFYIIKFRLTKIGAMIATYEKLIALCRITVNDSLILARDCFERTRAFVLVLNITSTLFN